MSLWKHLLTTIGIGAVKVDTILSKPQYHNTEIIEGVIRLQGGSTTEHIEKIYLTLFKREKIERHDSDFDYVDTVLHELVIPNIYTLKGNESKNVPFSMIIDEPLPVTTRHRSLLLQTHVFINNTTDAEDEDIINIIA